eukprot:TRINITY_DN517_c0_g3_i1.p1 TRINITY_DN517_c0_g3~~TRINITY_DN517_c0_g3_i1.p1  ORF type:complete len:269 (+),score=91.18 TRINITY_DN517_c0_g3_i1:54-860(+)
MAHVQVKKKTKEELAEKLKDLISKGLDAQSEFFLKSFIFDLGDHWKEVPRLAKTFRDYLNSTGQAGELLNPIQASDFLQKNGHERTALQRKEECKDIDLDNNDQISFVEYLLLHYKIMILNAYYKRTEEKCPYDLSQGGVGLTGCGRELLDELFTMPCGLSPELEQAIEDFSASKKARETKMKDLGTKAAVGGVKGKAAENELLAMQSEDTTALNRMELTLEAAKKKAMKTSGEQALKEKQKKEEEEKKKKEADGRAKLKNIAAAFEK